jgi:recombinational DNA repair protein RecR
MSTLKTVEELVKSKTRALLHPGVGLLYVREEDAVELLTQDRAAIHTSLIKAVEGLRESTRDCGRCNNCETAVSQCESIIYYNGRDQALDDTLTIINSIFKE